jgi:uracil-DNA glycosylase
MRNPFPEPWQPILNDQLDQPYVQDLIAFVAAERQAYTVYPPKGQVFTALQLTPFEDVRVLLLGQDPYHGAGQAHGLAFSVQPGVTPPPSLSNMFKELRDDLGCPIPRSGSLVPWAEQGVLLLNAVLTVRAGVANSHKDRGWERFTDAIISAVNAREKPVVFVLWGGYARKKLQLIDTKRHPVIQSAHPSPLSANSGFFGSRPFSKINSALESLGEPPIDWCLANH